MPGGFQGGSCRRRSQCGRFQARCHQTTEKHISQMGHVLACGRQVANMCRGFSVRRVALQRSTEDSGSSPHSSVIGGSHYSSLSGFSRLLLKIGWHKGPSPRECWEWVHVNSSAPCLENRGCARWELQDSRQRALSRFHQESLPYKLQASVYFLCIYCILYILICSLCAEKKGPLLAIPTFS